MPCCEHPDGPDACPNHAPERVVNGSWPRVITDSAGKRGVHVPLAEIPAGTQVYGGWEPHPVVDHIEQADGKCRMAFKDGHKGGWFPADEPVLCVAESLGL